MPSNDTENIYATQYGGEGEPIPATKISYDNTASELTADDAQEAIDEVVGLVETAQGDIDDLKTENSNYMMPYSAIEKVEVTGDGTKTVSEILASLLGLFNNVLDTFSNDEYALPVKLSLQGMTTADSAVLTSYLSKANKPVSLSFSSSYANTTSGHLNIVTASAGASSGTLYLTDVLNGTSTNTNLSERALTNGNKAQLFYQRYKKF